MKKFKVGGESGYTAQKREVKSLEGIIDGYWGVNIVIPSDQEIEVGTYE